MKKAVFWLSLIACFVAMPAGTGFAEEQRYTVASLGQWSSILNRNRPPVPMSKRSDEKKVAGYVCGAGGRSTYCADQNICCLARAGYYFCCGPRDRCGDNGYCY